MASPAYEQLLVVQDFDTQLVQLQHQDQHNPIRAEIAACEARLAEIATAVAEIEARKHEFDRQQKRLDDEVAGIEARRAEIDGKLYDGSVTATKDLLALQEEAAMLLERQTGVEDSELEVMQQVENVSAELAAAVSDRSAVEAEIERHQADLESALVVIRAEAEQASAGRAETAGAVPADLLASYEALRADFGGIAVARLVGSQCDGCHMTLSAVAVDQIKKQPDDAVVNCDQCGRLLIR